MAMLIDDGLLGLLDRWEAEREAGHILSAADLCGDCAALLPEAERQIAVLRQFHALCQPAAITSLELRDQAETTMLPAPSAPFEEALPLAGARVGRYQIVAELGRGGMGVVYRAHDTLLARDVALKTVRTDRPGTTERFLREARAMAAVRHDHVVEVYDYGEENGVRFVAMPLLAGETLAARIERQASLPAAEVIRIGRELAEGLAAVHEKGVIHRDLKPSNVWLEAQPDEPGGTPRFRVKLLDFGLARDPRIDDGLTGPGALLGTPAYMSPEQVNGLDLDARSDLFSLGSTLYLAATGRAAFVGPTVTALLHAVGETNPPPAQTVNPAVPVKLSNLIERLLEKRPADRPASAAEVAQELDRLAASPEGPTADTPATREYSVETCAPQQRGGRETAPQSHGRETAPQRQGWSRRARSVGASAAGLLLILALYLGYSAMHRSPETGPVKDPSPTPPIVLEPLRVRTLDVLQFDVLDKKIRVRGIIGKESFGATLDDDIRVTAQLSRAAYCYLIVFRPDGVDEVLYPQGANLTPDRTEEPRYPSKDRRKVYGLTDGTGLWLVALVASDQPLSAYADWRLQHPGGPWTKSEGEAGLVWLDDGNWLEAVTPRGVQNRGGRGEKKAAGASPVVEVVDWLKAQTGGVVSAVGFTVQAKR
jgi:serine/threonine protein kinase